ncbi:MAG TPA: Dabb family protein, partial [Blastocatellia bacterium]|nr:Dabb family protein [Blastocatellia bacterium]
DVIREFQVGYDIVRAARSYDMGLVSIFDDKAALDVYTPHPAHLPVVERARELCESVVSVDFNF